jgi:WD40 repeat protein
MGFSEPPMLVIDFSNHFTETQHPVRNVRISSDSRTLAATLGEAGKALHAVWWNLADNKPVGKSDIYPLHCRERPRTGSRPGSTASGRDYGGYPAYSNTFSDPVFTPDLARCAIHDFHYGSGSVEFHDVVIVAPGVSYEEGAQLALDGDSWEMGLATLAISPSGQWLLAGQSGGFVCRWDLRKVQLENEKFSKSRTVLRDAELLSFAQDPEDEWDSWDANAPDSLAVSVDGKWLATGHRDGEVRLFNFQSRKLLAVLQPPAGISIRGLNFSADDKWLAARSAEQVTVFDLAIGSALGKLKPPKLTDVAFHPDGTRLLTAGLDQLVHVWEVPSARPEGLTATWKEVKRYDWKIGPIHSVSVSPDGLTAAAGGEKNRIVVWDLAED